MQWNAKLWRQSIHRFKAFMTPLAAPLGRRERRVAATRYVQGLLMPGQRKSIEPLAARLGVDSQQLQQFLTDSPWDDQELWGVIRRDVLPHCEPPQAWIVDETGWLKQGQHSVGVARQDCGAVGKRANCQVSVELVRERWGGGRARWQSALPAPKLDRRLRPAAPRPGCRIVRWNQSSTYSACGINTFGSSRTVSPPSDRNVTGWSPCKPKPSSHADRRRLRPGS